MDTNKYLYNRYSISTEEMVVICQIMIGIKVTNTHRWIPILKFPFTVLINIFLQIWGFNCWICNMYRIPSILSVNLHS